MLAELLHRPFAAVVVVVVALDASLAKNLALWCRCGSRESNGWTAPPPQLSNQRIATHPPPVPDAPMRISFITSAHS
jgi:hypothetical protein